jgi:NlpC/P60 family putative phage cell wall peptidase
VTGQGTEIVGLARGWIGTPYVHQQSVQGAGCDCLGLVRGLWRALYGAEPEEIPPYSPDWAEPQRDEALWRAARRHLLEKPVAARAPGDVILFRMRAGSVAKHMGIVGQGAQAPSFIHAYSGHGVVESPLSPPWARRVVACFAFPERIS